MAKENFKRDITTRFIMVVDELKKQGYNTNTSIAKLMGQPLQVISKLLSGERIITLEQASTLANNSNIDLNWLLTGKGYMLKESKSQLKELPAKPTNTTGTPLVSVEAIGGFGNSRFAISENDVLGRYVVPDFAHLDFMIRVAGDSMMPHYTPGDIIGCRIIKESKFIQWGRVYVLATKEQGILIKRIDISEEKECIRAVSDNSNYKPFDIPKEEITGMALVVGVIRLE